MTYSNNPNLPKVRRDAASFARKHGVRVAARRFGVFPGTITKWMRKAEKLGIHPIPTLSSRPKHHPNELSEERIRMIVTKRLEHSRCAEVVHAELVRDGMSISLSSVKRTLSRRNLLNRRSPWKRYHPHIDRPYPLKAGDLVQMDTIHLMIGEKKRVYVYTLIDIYSRFAYAKAYTKMSGETSIRFLREAERNAPFSFLMIQSDRGPEFSSWFSARIGTLHRHTRIGKPNDNAHIERFNRTVQEECLDGVLRTPSALNKALKKYIEYYNSSRLHLGISLRSPMQLLTKCFQGID